MGLIGRDRPKNIILKGLWSPWRTIATSIESVGYADHAEARAKILISKVFKERRLKFLRTGSSAWGLPWNWPAVTSGVTSHTFALLDAPRKQWVHGEFEVDRVELGAWGPRRAIIRDSFYSRIQLPVFSMI